MPVTVSKIKAQLKMAVNRLRLVQQKRTALAKQQRRELGTLLENGKEQSAKIRVEIIIQEDMSIELLEMLELYCELLLARSALLDQPECDPGLEEAVKTIIYCAPRTEIKELHQIREMLMHKFGKEFAKDAVENESNVVPEKVLKRVSTAPPSQELVNLYLCEVAKAYQVPYSGLPDDEKEPEPEKTETQAEEPKKPKEENEMDALQARFAALRKR